MRRIANHVKNNLCIFTCFDYAGFLEGKVTFKTRFLHLMTYMDCISYNVTKPRAILK